MNRDFSPERLDVAAFAEAAVPLSANEALPTFGRLLAEAMTPVENPEPAASPSGQLGVMVHWEAQGEERVGASGTATPWLHVQAEVILPMVCQRCLASVDVPLQVNRWFRFVADEATAEIEDEEADEDVLVASREFDLRGLIEDELLMAIPVTPRHDVCPEPISLSVKDEGFDLAEEARPNPFAVLGALRPQNPD
jgi:uncharacterized protein